ncbi:GGDEF domain-containing protein [Marinobacter salinisoli]|uniref:diguanylate cyclase n=1 Tax=Marinobacter salinisoli TaxID=2769486 RepID=A0ABX7MP35_9GAMM|nr:GGDEF domain-containing protein [Marinobacter salinisoli]QSP94045.1 GGDEF domain-containing protein [Marinobacter salinisoli]
MKNIPSIQATPSQPRKLAALKQAHQDWSSASNVITRLTQRLSTTLALEEQLGILAEELSDIVPFDTLTYRHRIARQEFVYSTGLGGQHRCEYRLNLEGDFYGTLTICRRQRFSEEELQGIETLIGAAIYSVRNACRYIAIEQAALTDSLTGIPNKRALDDNLLRASSLSDRHGQAYSLILVDLDHFKQVNDTYGHVAGDHLLRRVGECLERALRTSDSVYRFGGEEFAVLLPHTGEQDARDVAERIRRTVSEITVDAGGERITATASFGVATHLKGEQPEQWVARADEALYRAKQKGRNRTEVFAAIA